MSDEFEFSFEELPLIVEGGFHAGLVNGSATIGYYSHGEWFVRAIALDGSRERSQEERANDAETYHRTGKLLGRFEQRPLAIDMASHKWLYLAIYDQLESGRFKDHVHDAVQKALEGAREDGGPRQRDDRDHHSTLNRAQTGV